MDIISKQGSTWNKRWEQWSKDQIQQRWEPENLKIVTTKNLSKGFQEVSILISPIPFDLLYAASVEIMIENPTMNIKKSVYYKWPIFSQYEK